ncbi:MULTISPECIES: NAD(P)H-hydrate dehydratase [unclassified Nitrospina]|uniref:NAD(P)H-hydrate dehydratase n=1 Tax=unclassified Nitrospina TaxID=2638683 RepID=UPI003F95B802
MQKVATALEMQAADRTAIEQFKIPGLVLMENAGRSVVDLMFTRIPDLADKKVAVLAGKGNNGGDGFVIARHLHQAGVSVRVLLAGKIGDLKGDARTNADIAVAIGIPVAEMNERNLNSQNHSLRHSHILVDALFGTGLSKPAGGLYAKLIQKINSARKYVVAVDFPSGIDADSGQINGPCVQADLTAALALFKRSHLLYPAAEVMGEIVQFDIGIPRRAVEEQNITVELVEETDIASLLPKRKRNTHKGTYGHGLVIGGSRGKGGAAGLTALAALRAGAGLVTLAIPESCNAALEFHPLEAMTLPLPETPSGSVAPEAVDLCLSHLKNKSALAIGPGLSTHKGALAFLEALLPQIACPVVIDADGLNGLAKLPGVLDRIQTEAVLTPHPKEMARLINTTTKTVQSRRIDTAREFAQTHGVTVLLKGAPTLVALADGRIRINPTGNPGMATGGTGDVLTGMIAGFLAQGLSGPDAAIAGAYLHGLAGDRVAAEMSETSLIAGDLLKALPQTLQQVQS